MNFMKNMMREVMWKDLKIMKMRMNPVPRNLSHKSNNKYLIFRHVT